MERVFAAIDDGVITNTFVADDSFVDLIRNNHDDVVEVTTISPQPGVAWTVHPDGYRPPNPFPSWTWNGVAWESPTPMPTENGPWRWDEETRDWIPVLTPAE